MVTAALSVTTVNLVVIVLLVTAHMVPAVKLVVAELVVAEVVVSLYSNYNKLPQCFSHAAYISCCPGQLLIPGKCSCLFNFKIDHSGFALMWNPTYRHSKSVFFFFCDTATLNLVPDAFTLFF